MSKLTPEQLAYIKYRTIAKRSASMTKPLSYEIAENFLLVASSSGAGWILNSPYAVSGPIVALLKEKIPNFKTAIETNKELSDKSLKELLKLDEIQFVLLKAEEGYWSMLQFSQEKKDLIANIDSKTKALTEQGKQADEKRVATFFSSSQAYSNSNGSAVSSLSQASSVTDPCSHSNAEEKPDVLLTLVRYGNYRTYTVSATKNVQSIIIDSKLRGKQRIFSLYSSEILQQFEQKYRAIQENRSIFAKIASVFSRDALAEASDPRPWYQRIFSTAPKKDTADKMRYLLTHAKNDPKSNTATALKNVLDEKAYAKINEERAEELKAAKEKAEARVVEEARVAEEIKVKAEAEVIRQAMIISKVAWSHQERKSVKFDSASERLAFEEKQARNSIFVEFESKSNELQVAAEVVSASGKANSPTPSVTSSLTSSTALSAAAHSEESVSPISFQEGRQRSDSQDSAASALMSSVRSGSFPPPSLGSSQRTTSVGAMEFQCKNRQEMLANLEKVFAPLWESLSMEVLSTRGCSKNGVYELHFNSDLNNAVRLSALVSRFSFEFTIQEIVKKYENAKLLYEMLVACRTTVGKSEITDDQVTGVLKKLATCIKTLNVDEQHSIVMRSELSLVLAKWKAKMEKHDALISSTPSM